MNSQHKHHPIFERFECWKGQVDAGFRVNFLGVKTREYMARTVKVYDPREDFSRNRFVLTTLPEFDEEYFQWVDLLEAASLGKDQFTMIELGAGYGRWLVNAAAALRCLNARPHKLIGLEAERTHFRWMKQHILDNGVDESSCELIECAISAEDGSVRFYTGNPSNWFGQRTWIPGEESRFGRQAERLKLAALVLFRKVKNVKAVSLKTLLKPLGAVDLIDLDLQGAEFMVLANAADEVNLKVRRVHIGTHGPEIESNLRNLFHQLGWKIQFDYPSNGDCPTPWGVIKFQDGVQSWINPFK